MPAECVVCGGRVVFYDGDGDHYCRDHIPLEPPRRWVPWHEWNLDNDRTRR